MSWGRNFLAIIGVVVSCLGGVSPTRGAEPVSPESLEFFETEIRPLFAEHCYQCHSQQAGESKAGLTLDSRTGLITGGDSGEAIVPDKPDESLLIEAIRYESYEMPPRGKLPDEAIAKVVRWVEMGAPWPSEPAPVADVADDATSSETFDLEARRGQHWAWQPITDPPLPRCQTPAWIANEIDPFILARLEAAELEPAPPADRLALARRLSFDLVGLPPSPEQVRRFLQDPGEDAYERLVDELLQSPHFGERWGRHWLDLVRYAESRGHEFDNDAHNAYQYRDYVIRAMNADVPYDQWIREHLAGDLLETPRLHPEKGFNESILGTGFWFLGEWVHSPVDIRKDEADRFDNMIDVMSKTFLGVTVACARCHDHKFDAITAADYYALSGFLQSSDYRQVRFDAIEQNGKIAEQLHALDREYRDRIEAALGTAGLLESPTVTPDSAPASDESAIPTAAPPRVVVDYGDLPPHGWRQDGYLFGPGPQQPGDLQLRDGEAGPRLTVAEYAAAKSDPFWKGLVSTTSGTMNRRDRLASLPRSGRTLRTPTFTVQDGAIGCRVRGEGFVVACVDSHRLIAGPLHGQTVQTIPAKPGHPLQWVHLPLERYRGHRVHLEFTPAEEASLEVLHVVDGRPFEAAFPETAPISERARRRAAAVAKVNDTPAGEPIRRLIEQWHTRRSRLGQQVRHESRLAMAMLDGTGENDHLLIRGSAANPGDEIPRRFLEAIDGETPLAIESGSGRLELAARINAPDNPLTSRVIVNRLWHHLLGRGIVPTTDDFGVLGQRPTHPELLDHLATWFAEHGHSIKKTIRYIVQSQTYRMSSQRDPAAFREDPDNLLWHHLPPKRLEGEVIRDALLKISGELDPQMFGEPVPVHLTPFMQGRGRPGKNGPLDGDRRRSIYTAVRRNFLSPFMLAFDTPAPFSTMGRRNVSNVPAQALILLNDPFVLGRAEQWAKRALEVVPDSPEARIGWMYETAYARPASDEEVRMALAFLQSQSAHHAGGADSPAVWADLAHALINAKEFIFIR